MKTLVAVALVAASATVAPLARADAGDQASAERAVAAAYGQFQKRCTPRTPPQFQSIQWERFTPQGEGSGRIIDANPGLGGRFGVGWNENLEWNVGQWGITFDFC